MAIHTYMQSTIKGDYLDKLIQEYVVDYSEIECGFTPKTILYFDRGLRISLSRQSAYHLLRQQPC